MTALRLVAFLLLTATAAGPTSAQSTPSADSASTDAAQAAAKTAVRATVDALFDAMRDGDSTAVRRVFAPTARLQTIVPADTASGRPATVRTTPVERFATAVGQPHPKVWDERIWDVVIQVDGPLATAWTPYAFYLGTDLSHCGTNAIQLVRLDAGWRIQHLVDTRHPAPTCRIPARIVNQ